MITDNHRETLYVIDGLGNLVPLQGVSADGSLKVSASLKQQNTIKFASISVSSSGDNLVVAAVPGKKIKVLSCMGVASGAVSMKWRSNATDLSGAISISSGGGFVLPASSPGQGHYLETAINEPLNINLSSAVAVNGHLTYYEE